jgi:hypothetical protein
MFSGIHINSQYKYINKTGTFFFRQIKLAILDILSRNTKNDFNDSLEILPRQIRAGLRWRGPAATVNYTPVLSSERVLQNNKPATV